MNIQTAIRIVRIMDPLCSMEDARKEIQALRESGNELQKVSQAFRIAVECMEQVERLEDDKK